MDILYESSSLSRIIIYTAFDRLRSLHDDYFFQTSLLLFQTNG